MHLKSNTMKKILYIASFLLVLLSLNSCVHFLPMTLNTADDNDPYFAINNEVNTDYLEKFTATDIFTDDIRNTWGTEKDACREFVVVDSVKKAGASSLLMTWDKSKKGCDWIGVGWAWNNWQVVDMSSIIDTWAVRFWIRTKQGTLPKVPLILSFIDDANKTTEYVSVSEKFYKGSGIDETWKEVIIPLSYFRFIPKGVNVASVSQLIMTFEGTGSVYFDEFQLINMSSKTDASGSKKESVYTATEVFNETTQNIWGIEKNTCRDFSLVTDVKKSGNSSLFLSWNTAKTGCAIISSGFAWNNWQVVNMTEIIDSYALRLWIRTKEGSLPTIPLFISLQDDGSISSKSIGITNAYYKGESIDTNWKEVIIPLSHFRCKEEGLNLFEISQLIMTFEGASAVYVDDISFIPYQSKK